MDTRDMKRSGWRWIEKRDYITSDCQIGGLSGTESLMVLKELSAPLTVRREIGGVDRKIHLADAGYFLLQIALKDQYYWLSAMYDDSGQLINIYIDITSGCHFQDPSNPTFEDMYLDIIVTDDGEVAVVDQEELEQAFAAGIITKAEYDRANTVCRQLYEYLLSHTDFVIQLCRQAFERLRRRLTV